MIRKPQNDGFTLLELIVTIAVIAILVTIGIPSFQEMIQRNRLRSAAETLYADMQLAKSESIKQGRQILISVVGTGSAPWTTWCYGLDDDNSTACNCSTTPDNCTIRNVRKTVTSDDYPNVKIKQNFDFGTTDSGVTGFDPIRGIALDSGTVELSILIAGQDKEVQVRLSNVGRILICSPSITSKRVYNYETCPD